MKYNDWIHNVIDNGNVCSPYVSRLGSALSKKQIVDVCLTADGITFISQMCLHDNPLPYETIAREFSPYINGKYVRDNKSSTGHYTASIWCCTDEGTVIEANATAMAVLGCNSTIRIKPNGYVKVYTDNNCHLKIECPQSARCCVEYCEGSTIEVVDNFDRVKLIEHKKETK